MIVNKTKIKGLYKVPMKKEKGESYIKRKKK